MEFAFLFTTPSLAGLLALLCVAYCYYNYFYKPLQFFKEIGIPGPNPKPLIGNLDLIRKCNGDLQSFSKHIISTYGPISGFFFGTRPVYFIADVDIVRDITVKHFDKFTDRLLSHYLVDSEQVFRRENARFWSASLLAFDKDHHKQRGILVTHVNGKVYDGVFASNGDEWKKRRHVLTPAFSANKMKLMEPLIKESTSRLAQKISAIAETGETVEALQMYNKMTMEVILSTAFGRAVDVQGGQGGRIFEAAVTVFNAFAPPEDGKGNLPFKVLQFLPLTFPFTERLAQRIMTYMDVGKAMDFLAKSADKIIQGRRLEADQSALRKDLLQLMLDASDSDETQKKLQSGEIIADSVGFLLAGYETTSTAITFATYLLAVNPTAQEKLANEIHEYLEENPAKSLYDATHELQYLDMVLEETLRMYSPATVLIRFCDEDCVLKGVQIRKNSLVFLAADAIHHDPNVWTDPEVFNPERFALKEKAERHPCAFLPFGNGPRNCIGMRFALLEAKMALIEIVSKFRIILAPETKVPLEVMTGATLKPKHGVFVKFETRTWS